MYSDSGLADDSIALRVDGTSGDRRSVARQTRLASRVNFTGRRIDFVPCGRNLDVVAGGPLRWCEVTDATVLMLVVPVHKLRPQRPPLTCSVQVLEAICQELRPVFSRAKQGFDERVLLVGLALAGLRELFRLLFRAFRAKPTKNHQHSCRFQRRTVVAMHDKPIYASGNALGQRYALNDLDGMCDLVGRVHFPGDDLAAADTHNQIQVKPHPGHCGRQVGHIPSLDLVNCGGNVRARHTIFFRRPSSSAMSVLALRPQQAAEGRFTRRVDPFVGQGWQDPRRLRISEARFVGDSQNRLAFFFYERISWRWIRTSGLRALVARLQRVLSLPALLHGAQIDHRSLAEQMQPRAGLMRIFDVSGSSLAILQPDHSGSLFGKFPRVFFTTLTAVSSRPAFYPCTTLIVGAP